MSPSSSVLATALRVIVLTWVGATACFGDAPSWQARHDQLVARLRALAGREDAFGPAYRPLYRAALPWYEQWGGRTPHAVDDGMVPPDDYAAELADAMEHGRNFLAENSQALLPLVFEARLPGGKTVRANYWLALPAGFPEAGRVFPLVIGLHGSGWLGHPLSFVRAPRRPVAGRRTFEVTPINEAGPWQIDFLNAFLDELLKTLPVDRDRVYVEGHSLGAMATWEWALDNPERFAAISPRAGRGEPFRAGRLKNLPAWVIHGADDDVVPTGFSDQMVTALEACGGRVRYTVLRGVPHNMPPDLDEQQVVDWYFQQTRSPLAAAADPRDGLGITPAGFSPWAVIAVPERRCWKSDPAAATDNAGMLRAAQFLFQQVHDRGELADAPLELERDLAAGSVRLWLAVPRPLRLNPPAGAAEVSVPAAIYVRFYFRGTTADALAHLAVVAREAEAAGHHLATGTVWITPLTLWPDAATTIAEYRMAIR